MLLVKNTNMELCLYIIFILHKYTSQHTHLLLFTKFHSYKVTRLLASTDLTTLDKPSNELLIMVCYFSVLLIWCYDPACIYLGIWMTIKHSKNFKISWRPVWNFLNVVDYRKGRKKRFENNFTNYSRTVNYI